MEIKFIADNNVGKLARWLRVMGYDTLLFRQKDDDEMIKIALSENRVILTKDAQLMKRRLVTNGKLKAMIIEQDDPATQLREAVKNLSLSYHFKPFSLCLECNHPLMPRTKEEVQNLVPPYVFKTQNEYMECPTCHRIYWQGTHWQAMVKQLRNLQGKNDSNPHL
jgi:uncharacterized protein with PIN domain